MELAEGRRDPHRAQAVTPTMAIGLAIVMVVATSNTNGHTVTLLNRWWAVTMVQSFVQAISFPLHQGFTPSSL